MTMIDLNHTRTKREIFSRSIVEKIDTIVRPAERLAALEAIAADIEDNPPQPEQRAGRSISASAIGDECARRIQLNVWPTFHPDRPVKRLPFDAKTLAIFERGHRTEPLVADWMQRAGYDLITRTADDQQFGFQTANGQIKGFADGVLRDFLGAKDHHALWENKTISAKNWRAVVKHGVLKQYPKYDMQVQILCAYLEINAALFSFLNAETGELFFELTPFDPQRAQVASDRAVWLLRATRAGDLLPRVATSQDGAIPKFPCAFCEWREECF